MTYSSVKSVNSFLKHTQKGAKPRSSDAVTPEEEIKDPFVLEFLGLKDEYSESDLEEALQREDESIPDADLRRKVFERIPRELLLRAVKRD